jgi:hypothetical protein
MKGRSSIRLTAAPREIRQWQAQHVAEDPAAEHGIDAVAGMQDEVLPHPGER